MSRGRRGAIVSSLLLVALSTPLAGQATSAAPAPATFDVLLRPVRAGGPEVTAIEVESVLSDVAPEQRRAFGLRAPIVYAGVPGIADRVLELDVRDDLGALPLRVEDDPPAPGGFPYFRHWWAERAVRPPILISYRSLVQPAGSPGGPPFGIRPSGGGVSGAGSGFLVIPETEAQVTSHVRWELAGLAPGSVGLSNRGEGDVTIVGSPAGLTQLWYMAGPAGRYPPGRAVGGFGAAWLGEPPFDPEAEMAWVAEMYTYLGDFFGYLDPVPEYRVFVRVLDTPPFGGGTALGSSFMLSRGPPEPGVVEEPPRGTFVHEMVHMWVGGIEAPQGVNSWFSEGLTTHYARRLPMRGGHDSVEAYGRDVNDTFERYFTSAARNLSADSIATLGFGDETARRVPYLRGSLYFADLDARIREASGGRRTLDDLMAAVFARRESGLRLDHEAWIEAVSAETGRDERAWFESVVLAGETIVPRSDAFGPCFERRAVLLPGPAREVDGYEWVRRPQVPDARCRTW